MRWLAALVAAGMVVVATPRPSAADARFGLIDVPDDLDAALRTALEPWGVTLDALPGPPPDGDAIGVRRAAAELAQRERLDGLLWVSTQGDVTSMWMYDVDTAELSVRAIPATRDPATAAALALTAKAMLRTTVAAPPRERFGAVASPLVVDSVSQLRVHTSIGLRRIVDAEPRLGLGLGWWPAALRGRAGVVVGVVSGPGLAIDDPLLIARFTDTAGTIAARGRLGVAPRLTVDGGVGLSVHATSLDGFSPAHRIAVDVQRTNGALDLDVALAVALGPRAELAIDGAVGVALRRQRYLIGGAPVLELPAAELRLGLELRVHMP